MEFSVQNKNWICTAILAVTSTSTLMLQNFFIDSAPGDYTPLNAQLQFSFGQMAGTVMCANLAITDDNVVEENEESITLTLSADDPPVTTITASGATVLIRENDNDGKFSTISYNALCFKLCARSKCVSCY